MASLEFKNISKRFDQNVIVEDLSLTVNDGELFVLLGPSGCGKSTTLRLIAGLESVDSGEILIDGRVVNKIPPKDRNVAMVFQNYALYPHMTIFDNLAFPLKIKKVPTEKIRQVVEKQAALLGLTELLERKPKTLSGGQRQRVALGRALVREPKLFLFDEPLSNLDAKLRVSTRAEIAQLQKTLNATMIYVTHDQEEALSLGHRIAILNDGILQQIGTPIEIYNDPLNIFCAGFVGNPKINLINLKNNESLVSKFNLKMKQPLTVGIRPENIFFESPGGDSISLAIKLDYTEFTGDRYILFGSLDKQEIRIKSRTKPKVDQNQKLTVFFKPADCLFFQTETGVRVEI